MMDFFHLTHCCAYKKGNPMQYTAYFQMILWVILVIVAIWLLLVVYSNRRELREIRKWVEKTNCKATYKSEKQKPDDNYKRIETKDAGEAQDEIKKLQNDLRFLKVDACKNLSSDKYFIILEEIDDLHTKMILPTGDIKILENELFDEFEDLSLGYLLENSLITKDQIEAYFNFLSTNTGISTGANEGSKYYREEPTYIKNYRAMLSNPDTWPSKLLATIISNSPITLTKLKVKMDKRYDYSPSESNGSFGASLKVLALDGYIRVEGQGNSKIIIAQQNVREGRL